MHSYNTSSTFEISLPAALLYLQRARNKFCKKKFTSSCSTAAFMAPPKPGALGMPEKLCPADTVSSTSRSLPCSNVFCICLYAWSNPLNKHLLLLREKENALHTKQPKGRQSRIHQHVILNRTCLPFRGPRLPGGLFIYCAFLLTHSALAKILCIPSAKWSIVPTMALTTFRVQHTHLLT